jgi:subtilase family serine protease
MLATNAGATVTISDTAINQGGGSAAASFTQYYLSTFTTKIAGSRLLTGIRSLAGFNAGSASAGTVTAMVPSDMATGTYYLLACADDTNVIAETNESNNCAAAAVRVQVGPDLIESGVSSQSYVTGAGATIAVTDTAINQGRGAAAAATFTQFYLSSFTTKTSASRLLVGARAVSAIAAAATSAGSINVSVPADVLTGTYYLLACADDTNLLLETNDTNNCTAAPTRMQVGPDLIASAVSASATLVAPGGSLTINDTAMNQGGGSAAVSTTQFYLSPFTTKNTAARLLPGNRGVGPLPPAATSPGTTTITVPTDMALGTFYLLACADDTNVVAETNENNNCAPATLRVQVSP